MPLERLRWITFGHLEADECGAMNQFLAAAPDAQVAHGALGCMVSIDDLADRPPRPLGPDEVLDLGGKRIRNLDTPHVPHGWDAHALYEETTGTLFCGDLMTQVGAGPGDHRRRPRRGRGAGRGHVPGDVPHAADRDARSARSPSSQPARLAIMHGSSFEGDGAAALLALADDYDRRLAAAGE